MLVMRDSPRARAAKISDRCEIDLSPGTLHDYGRLQRQLLPGSPATGDPARSRYDDGSLRNL
jgi:hypothetical protein